MSNVPLTKECSLRNVGKQGAMRPLQMRFVEQRQGGRAAGRQGALHANSLENIPRFSIENAQKMGYGGSTECLYTFSVVSITLCTKYHRIQVQNSRTPFGTGV